MMGEGRPRTPVPGSALCCCGCCSVRVGTIIITIVWLILGGFAILRSCRYLIILADTKNYDAETLVELEAGVLAEDREYRELLKKYYTNYRTLEICLTTIGLTVELIGLILSAFCLLGAVKRGPSSRLVPWIWLNSITGLLSAIAFIAVGGYYASKRRGGGFGFCMLLFFVVGYSCYYYLIRVVHRYVQELRHDEQRRRKHADRGTGTRVSVRV